MIEVNNLTKNYGSVTAVNDVSFTIEKGHVYGLLGPNGAGKSTIMNIMTGCLAATSGTVKVNGHDIYEEASAAKSGIGYLPEVPPLYPDMTPNEYLRFIAKVRKVKSGIDDEVKRVSKLCGITSVSEQLIRTLSKGYRQRVGIAGTLIGDPEIVILDEPTVGLDPLQLIEVRALISQLKQDHAVILSSHIMGEIAAVCDYIIIMAYGEIVAEGTLDELEKSRKGRTITVISSGDYVEIKEILSEIEGVDYVITYPRGDYVKSVIETKEGFDIQDDIRSVLEENEIEVREVLTARVSIEDIFIRLTTEAAVKKAEKDAERSKPKEAEDTEKRAKEYNPLASPYLNDEDQNADPESGEGAYTSLFSGDDETAIEETAETVEDAAEDTAEVLKETAEFAEETADAAEDAVDDIIDDNKTEEGGDEQ